MTDPAPQPIYYVVSFVTKYRSLAEVKAKAPDVMRDHIVRSKQFHAAGTLLMAGAFREDGDEPVTTMGILTSRAAAEEFARGDPFLLAGMVSHWHIREWANMFA